MKENKYTISEAARLLSVENHVLRYWEEELELNIPRNELGHRYYREEEIQLLHCIKELKNKGFQLKAVKEVLPDLADGEMFFKKMELSDLQCNPFDMIGKSWYLLTSGTPEDYNTMTASWGAMGEIWGAPSFHCVVRTNRYTLQYLDRNELFSACFFDPGYKPALQFCGTHSGRDCDKAKQTGLRPVLLDGTTAFAQARRVLICRKRYTAMLVEYRSSVIQPYRKC